jgi:NitT/TauT family transport system substrate-binding protein
VFGVLALVLVGCGDDDDAEPTTAAPTTAAPTTAAPGGTEAPATTAAPTTTAEPMSAAGLPLPEKTSLNFGISALEFHSFPLHYASSTGILEKYGIEELNETYTEGVATAIQALQAGRLDVQAGTGSSVLSSLVTDTPFLTIGSTLAKMTDGLFSTGDITSMEELRGKKIAISTFGGESHAAVVLALGEAGLTQEDVEITQIGGQGDRIAALIAGSVSAAPVDSARRSQMEDEGLNMLINLADTDVQLPRGGLNVTREFAEENPNTCLALVAATIEAIQAMKDDPEAAIDEHLAWSEEDDREASQSALEEYLAVAQADLRISNDAWVAMREVLKGTNPAVVDVDVTQAYTTEFIDQLVDLGFFEQMGIDV